MAIQQRRGAYADFDPSKMIAGEPAVVLSGDPNVSDGKAAYVAFGTNDVKRLVTGEELENKADKTDIHTYYGTCDTQPLDNPKIVVCPEFQLVTGARIAVIFTTNMYGMSTSVQSLNVNGTGSIQIRYHGKAVTVTAKNFHENEMYEFVYDGTYFQLVGDLDTVRTVDSSLSATSSNPVRNSAIKAALDTKVDAVSGKGLSTNDFTDAEKDKLDELDQSVTDLKEDLSKVDDRVTVIEKAVSLERYGVSGIGQSANALTRLYDAVGAVAQVGTDGDNSNVRNDFDNFAPWNWRKCVGHWTGDGDRAIFHVHAYKGDADYTEDGTNGDYVAVECPRCYVKDTGSARTVSMHQHEGYVPFDIFCHNHNPQDTIPYFYRPAYALTIKDGKAVSLPGLDNEQGAYKTLVDAARTYDGGALGTLPMLYPMALSYYDETMFMIEFANQNCQSIMYGCGALRHNADDRLTFVDATHALVSNWYATRVAGEYIAIVPTNIDINSAAYKATHKIVTVTRCTADGTPSTSGTYTLLELEDLEKAYFAYDTTGATEYRICGRPYRTGSCNGVSTPSGSPVSNTNGCYPMKYRWVENIYGNQYKTTADLFNKRVGTGDDDWKLEHYYLLKPWEYTPSSTSKPDATDLATDKFVKLNIETEHANYVNGYVKSKKYSDDYPQIWIPYETAGASASTFFCDYASLVNSYVVRSVRLYGAWYSGAIAGLSFFDGHPAPSTAAAYYGGDLCFPQ